MCFDLIKKYMNTFKEYVNNLSDFIGNTIGGLIITLAVSAFLFTVFKFIVDRNSGQAGDGLKDAKNRLGWGIIALFVLFSVWGIISFLQTGIFEGGVKTQIEAPSVKINSNSTSGAKTSNTSSSAVNGGASGAGRGQAKAEAYLKDSGYSCNVDSECKSNLCVKEGRNAMLKFCK